MIKNPIQINNFIKSINKNAPISMSTCAKGDVNNIERYKGLKYPYKPALIIALFENVNLNDVFNKDISIIDNQKIIKTYYDILMNSEILCTAFESMSGKTEWMLGYNDKSAKKILSNIFENPAQKLLVNGDEFYTINKSKYTIRFNYKFDNENEKQELKDLLLSVSYECLKKCIPEYKDLSYKEIFNYQDFIFQEIYKSNKDINEDKNRRYQHNYAKAVKDRDKQCVICKIDMPNLLDACHIKPYSHCDNIVDRYNPNNGITMCKNHHKLFDIGMFTFNDEGLLSISNNLSNDYHYILEIENKSYHSIISNIGDKIQYIQYHQKYIFNKK